MRLIRNASQTPDGTILESKHRHDYRSHNDANGKTYVIDGGLDYVRATVHNDQISLALYDTEPHSIQAQYLTWGSFGIRGDQPRSDIRIADMETSHLEAVLRECSPTAVLKNCMTKELECRQDIHRTTAAEVFGVENDEVTADQRRSAKAINFGLIHGMEIKK